MDGTFSLSFQLQSYVKKDASKAEQNPHTFIQPWRKVWEKAGP